ncbi:hypothetical protein LAZ67_8001516, partial [Cordylochernes scorpioides]
MCQDVFTLDELHQTMNTFFPVSTSGLMKQFWTEKKLPSQPLMDYYFNKLKLAKILNISSEQTLEALSSNVNAKLRPFLIAANPANLDMWIKIAYSLEEGFRHEETSSPFNGPRYRGTFKISTQGMQRLHRIIFLQVPAPAESSPVTLAHKKGENDKSRLCIDFRKLNSKLIGDSLPIPLVENIIQKVQGSKVFSCLDILSAYWTIGLHEKDQPLTCFTTTEGSYQWCRLPFGLRTAPAIFNRILTSILQKYELKNIISYFDDILVFSKDTESHLEHLGEIFAILQEEGIQLRKDTCLFFMQKINYLGYEIFGDQISPSSTNVGIIKSLPPPRDVRCLRSFLGSITHYAKFIDNFNKLRAPLNDLLKKDVKFTWNEECQRSFEALKEALVSKPILQIYNPLLATHIFCDASMAGLGGVLKQEYPDGTLRPIAFYSRALRGAESKYTITELELLAIIETCKRYHPYISGQHVIVHTDHKALIWLNNFKHTNVKLWDPVTEDNTEPPFPFQKEEDLEGCLGVEPNKQASTDSPQVLFSSIKKNPDHPTEPLEKLMLVSVDTQTESEPVVSCEVFQRLSQSKINTIVDVKNAYWHIPIDEKDRHKTSFVTQLGCYEWNRLPYSLKNAPSQFERIMKSVLTKHNINYALNYFDNIIIHTPKHASSLGVAGVLKQPDEQGILHPIGYFSRKLHPYEQNYTASEIETLAIINSVQRFHTDHLPLMDQKCKKPTRLLLEQQKLLELLEGLEIKPNVVSSDSNSESSLQNWKSKDVKARMLLSQAIELRFLQPLMNCTFASQMWQKLLAIHEQKSEFTIGLLWQQFFDARLTSETISDYIAKIQNISAQISQMGGTITEDQKVAKILNTLPSNMGYFVAAWESLDPKAQTLNNLTARLLIGETRNQQSGSSKPDEALLHRQARTKPKDTQRSFQDAKKNTKCHYCHKIGHWSRECRKRLANEKNKSKNLHDSKGSSSDYGLILCDNQVEPNDIWYADSGASCSMTFRREWFKTYTPFTSDHPIYLGDNSTLLAEGMGDIEIQAYVDGGWYNTYIRNVLYSLQLKKNLYSLSTSTRIGFNVIIKHDKLQIFMDNDLKAVGVRHDGLYRMLFKVTSSSQGYITSENKLQLWHERLAHLPVATLREMATKGLVDGLQPQDLEGEFFFCEGCQLGKAHRKSCYPSDGKNYQLGEFIYADICGPMQTQSLSKYLYFCLFKDYFSGYRHIYFIKNKSDVLDIFKEYATLIYTQTGNKIKVLRTDNALEFKSDNFADLCKRFGIIHEFTAPYVHEQIGRIERDNRTIVEAARSMLNSRNLPGFFWAEACNTATYILNRSATKQTPGTTPYELFFATKPNVANYKIFGCNGYMHIPKENRKKWDNKSIKLMFLGYENTSKNFRLWDWKTRKIRISKDVTFDEKATPHSDRESTKPKEIIFQINSAPDESPVATTNFPVQEMLPVSDISSHPMITRSEVSDSQCNFALADEPSNYIDAITSSDSERWKLAMDEEIDALNKNKTWTLERLADGHKPIGCKWVYKIKTESDGTIQRFKARLVAKGYSQIKNVYYFDTFSPVVRYDSLRILLSHAASERMCWTPALPLIGRHLIMEPSESLTKIAKLNGLNYSSWSFQIKLILMDNDLWSIVDPGEVKPEGGDVGLINKFNTRQNKALAKICLSIESEFTSANIRRKLLAEAERRNATTNEGMGALSVRNSNKKQFPHEHQGSKTVRKCFGCGKTGHIARDCFKLKKNNGKQQEKGAIHQHHEAKNLSVMYNAAVVSEEDTWVIDSGSTHHMTPNRRYFSTLNDENVGQVTTIDGTSHSNIGRGNAQVDLINNSGQLRSIVAQNAMFVPGIRHGVLSVLQIVENGHEVIFDKKGCHIYDNDHNLMIRAEKRGRLYLVRTAPSRFPESGECSNSIAQTNNFRKFPLNIWHQRLMHINYDTIVDMMKREVVIGLNCQAGKSDKCSDCMIGKSTKRPFLNLRSTKETQTLALVHCDLMGPFNIESWGGSRFVLTIIDDASRYTRVYFLKRKGDTLEKFKKWMKEAENQTGFSLKRIRTDNGLEFCSSPWNIFTKAHGIVHERTMVYTPEQNGVAERMNRTLLNLVRSTVNSCNLPTASWAELTNTAAYLRNRVTNRHNEEKTPFELWFGKRPALQHLRAIGCETFVHVPKQRRNSKLQPRATKGILKEASFQEESNADQPVDRETEELIGTTGGIDQLFETLPENLRSHPMTLRSHGKTAESPEEDNSGGQINAVKYHFVREKISEEAIELFYTPSAENPADFLTKPLARSQHENHNFKTSDADPCIFIGTHNDSNVILALYVDDGIILSKDKEAIAIIMDELEHAFDITSGSVNFFVGLQIEQSEDRASIFIHQSSYIDKILSKFNMADCIPASVPMDPSVILTKQDCPTPEQKEKMPKFPFREAVGSLMFASCVSRPDITYAVSQVSKFLEYPGPAHCTTVKNIFRYLKGTLHMGILFTGQDQLVGYSDSDFARDVDSRKSTTGYAFMMNGGTVSWASQRQPIIALSTTESEYIAACSAAKELIWIRRLLQGIGCDITKETELYIDNQAAIKLVENPVFHKRTKHINVRYHFIRSKHEEGELKVHHVCSSEQLADIMTKPLPRNKFHYLR